MSDLNDLIHTNATIAFNQGVERERERWEAWLARIRTWTLDKSADYQEGALFEQQRTIKLLEPLAECDKEMCGTDGETHYGLDCDAFSFQYAINLIKGEQK
jgi:hypothetical protein